MGPFMVEIVFCPVTRRGRKKRKGQNKDAITGGKNDGPIYRFVPLEDTVKISLDLSEDGPIFSALDMMLMKLVDQDADERDKSKSASDEAKKALKNLLRSGIPGIESMFAGLGGGGVQTSKQLKSGKLAGFQTKSFHKMTAQSRTKFMKAVFGSEGNATIDASTAAALLAAAVSGGDPNIGDKIAQLLVPEIGDTVDQNMMAALMASSSMINAGAGTEEIMRTMTEELGKSGMAEEEILAKTKALMKVFGKEDVESSLLDLSLVSKQQNSALRKAEISPKEYAKLVLCQRILSSTGVSAQDLAKMLIIQSQLSRRGAQNRHIAEVLNATVGDTITKAKQYLDMSPNFHDEKLKKDDVLLSCRLVEALENENEPNWKEVKQMKDILGGASTSSAEAIGLNLQRALKSSGLSRLDMANVLQAQKMIAAADPNPQLLARLMLTEKSIAANGVPPVEIARVLADGNKSKEMFERLSEQSLSALEFDLKEGDIAIMVKIYDQLAIRSNVQQDVIDHIDRNLIQVRCSLEDVAANHFNSMRSRGEKDSAIARSLCQVLKKTNASTEIVMSTMFAVLRDNLPDLDEFEIVKMIGRANVEASDEYDVEEILSALKSLQQDTPDISEEVMKKGMEHLLRDLQWFPDEIRNRLEELYPPPPPPPKKEEEPDEIDFLTADEILKKFTQKKSGNDSESSSRRNSNLEKKPSVVIQRPQDEGGGEESLAQLLLNRKEGGGDSRRGSFLGSPGSSRRGSFLNPETTRRSSLAVVVDGGSSSKKKKRKKKISATVEVRTGTEEEEDNRDEEEEEEDVSAADASGDDSDMEIPFQSAAQLEALRELNAEKLLIQNHLENGGIVGDDGQLYDEEGIPVLGEDGTPIVLDNTASHSAAATAAAVDENMIEQQLLFLANKPKTNTTTTAAKLITQETLGKKGKSVSEAKATTATTTAAAAAAIAAAEGPQADKQQYLSYKEKNMARKKELRAEMSAKSLHKGANWSANLEDGGGAVAGGGTDERHKHTMAKTAKDDIENSLQSEYNNSDANNNQESRQQETGNEEMLVNHKALPNGTTPLQQDQLNKIQQQMKGATATEMAQVALAQGATAEQAVKLAKAQGATPAEIAKIQAQASEINLTENSGVSNQTLAKIQQQMKGATATEMAQVALAQGATAEQAVKLAKAQGATPAEIAKIQAQAMDIASNVNTGVSNQTLAKIQQQMKGASATEIAQVALAQGATADQVVKLAKAQGATPAEIAQIQVQANDIAINKNTGVSNQTLAKIQQQMNGATATEIAQAALAQGATSEQAVKLAKAQGATPAEIATIQAQASEINPTENSGLSNQTLGKIQQQMKGASATVIAQAALAQGATSEQAVKLAKAQGATPAEIAKIKAQAMDIAINENNGVSNQTLVKIQQQMKGATATEMAQVALAQGATAEQAVKLAKAQGATPAEIAKIQAQASDIAISNNSGVSNQTLAKIQQQMKSATATEMAQVALAQGATAEQAVKLAKAQGATPAEIAQIQVQANDIAIYENNGVSNQILAKIQQQMRGATASEIAQVALAQGATAEQAVKLAKAQGATPAEIAKIQVQANNIAINEKTGVSNQTLAKIQQQMMGATASEMAQVALAQGATAEQAVKLAKAQGATPAEIAKIQAQANDIAVNESTGLSNQTLANIQQQMKGASASEMAQVALAQGATAEQVVKLAKAQGATPAEIAMIQAHASEIAMNSNSGLSNQTLAKIQQQMKGATATEMAQVALAQGATAEQAGKLAKAQGATPAEIAKIQAQAMDIASNVNTGVSNQTLAKIQQQMKGASATEIAQVALAQGATADQVVKLAKAQGATPAEIAKIQVQANDIAKIQVQANDIAINENTGVSNQTLAKIQQQMKGASATVIAQAALAQGATAEQAVKIAKAEGATTAEIAKIQAQASEINLTENSGVSNQTLAKIQQQMKGASATVIAQAALAQGATSEQAVKLAKAQGATPAEIAKIKAQAMDIAINENNGVSNQTLAKIQQQMKGASATEIAQVALAQGATAEQAVKLAKAQGATPAEIAKIQTQAMDIAINENTGVSNQTLAKIQQQMKGASATEIAQVALGQGATAEQVVNLAKAQGATPAEIAKIQAQASGNNCGVSNQTLTEIQQKMKGATATEVAQAALAKGATQEQAVKLAKAQGASPVEIAKIQAHLQAIPSVASNGISAQLLNNLQQQMSAASATELAQVALSQGVTISQVLKLAQSQGASPVELSKIQALAQATNGSVCDSRITSQSLLKDQQYQKGINDLTQGQKLTQGASHMEINMLATQIASPMSGSGVSPQSLIKLQQQMRGASATELAKAAMEQGASLTQVLKMAQAQGASSTELSKIQVLAQSIPSAAAVSENGISAQALIKLQQQMRGASATELAQAALSQGASTSQVLKLAQSQGVTPLELANIQAHALQSSKRTSDNTYPAGRSPPRDRAQSRFATDSSGMEQRGSGGVLGGGGSDMSSRTAATTTTSDRLQESSRSVRRKTGMVMEENTRNNRNNSSKIDALNSSYLRNTVDEDQRETAATEFSPYKRNARNEVSVGDRMAVAASGAAQSNRNTRKEDVQPSYTAKRVESAEREDESHRRKHSHATDEAKYLLKPMPPDLKRRNDRDEDHTVMDFRARRSSRMNSNLVANAQHASTPERYTPVSFTRNTSSYLGILSSMGSSRGSTRGSDVDLASLRFRTTVPLQRTSDFTYSSGPSSSSSYSTSSSTRNISSGAASKVPGLSNDEVAQLMSVFKMEGIVISKGGVNKYRSEGDVQSAIDLSEEAFAAALEELEKKNSTDMSDESRKKLEELLRHKSETIASLRKRLLQSRSESRGEEDYSSSRRTRNTYTTSTDLYQSPYLRLLEGRTLRSDNFPRMTTHQSEDLRFQQIDSPLNSPYYSSSILRPSVRRRFLLRKQMEEDRRRYQQDMHELEERRMKIRRGVTEEPKETTSSSVRSLRDTTSADRKTSTAPGSRLMVYTSGGFTRCLRFAKSFDDG